MNNAVRILLVEDNPADVYLFRKALTEAGLDFELTVIEDGGSAIAFVRGDGAGGPVPDLAVIDLSLPKDSGIQIVQELRARERFSAMPVVIASSSPEPPPSLQHEQLRIARYITKPPDLDDFLQIGVTLKEILLESRAGRAGD